MDNKIITNFPITVYGKMERFSDTISKGRCRVFYKGRNRNGTYITDEFAQKLIDSAPYTPVKGIYDEENADYTDHGKKRDEGRIYGIIPANPNFAWEKHVDSNGVEKEYACFDVLYYTALYKEAGQINGKSESMELYRQTLKGEWKIIEGKKTYVFTDGCFLGLQALGDDIEPCFEGASFYSCENNILALLEKYEKKTNLFTTHEQGGNNIMPSITYKISDSQKYDFLFNLLNPNFNEAGNWTIECTICEVYENYAIVRNYTENIFERVYYTKDDEKDSLEIVNRERCYIVDINDTEKDALNKLKGENTYEQVVVSIEEKDNTINSLNDIVTEKNNTINSLNTTIEENNNTIAELNIAKENLSSENSNYSAKIEELNGTISTLTIERDETQNNYTAACSEINQLKEANLALNENLNTITVERDNLVAYKKKIEDDAKKAVIDNYVEHLPEDIIEAFTTNLDNYTIEELDKELTYAQKKANPSLFTKASVPPTHIYIPKDEGGNGINDILDKYEKH